MTLNDRLKDVVGAEALTPETQLSEYAVDGLAPQAVVSPANVDALCQVVSFAAREGLSITPWGGGTQMSLGNPPSKVDIVVKTTGIDKVTEHSESDFTMAVGAGASIGWVQDYLASKGQQVPLDAPLPGRATVGGMLATATTTPCRLLYNLPRDWVLGMKVVQPDGSRTGFGGRVMKNVSGYDAGKLYIGSFGTLGIIVEATLRLLPATRSEVSFVATYASVAGALKAARSVLGQRFIPQCAEVVAGEAMKVLPEAAKKDGASAALLISVAGWPSATKRMTAEMNKLLSGAESLETLSPEAGAKMWRSLTDLGWQKGGAPLVSLRASVAPSKVDSALSATESLSADGLKTGTVVGPGYGGVRFLAWAGQGAADPDKVRSLAVSFREQVARLEGYVIVESCSPKTKAGLDVWGKVPGGLEVMRRLKREIDPKGICNPGRFVEGI